MTTKAASMSATDMSTLAQFCDAIACDLAELATLHDTEPDAELLESLRKCDFPSTLKLHLTSSAANEGSERMRTALESLPTSIDQQVLDELAADYAAIYLTLAVRASPNESVWIDDEQLERQQPMFQVREYYRRHGLAAANWRQRADDHLVLQLQFLSHLFKRHATSGSIDLSEVTQFMDEHLLRWLPEFGARVSTGCATLFFAGLAQLTAGYCEELRELLATILDEPRPSQEEIDQRMAPKGTVQEVPLRFIPGIGPSV